MVAVHVCDKDARELAEAEGAGAKNLVLCPFAAIEQPPFAALRKLKRHARDVTLARRHSSACSQKSYSQDKTELLRKLKSLCC